jgi:hypothetical protein
MTANANFFPAALPSDGNIDLVCIDGHIGRLTALKSFLAVESGNFYDMEHVSTSLTLIFQNYPSSAPLLTVCSGLVSESRRF